MRYSLSEMLHICKFCKKDFVGLKNLKSHEKKKHQKNLRKRAVNKQKFLQETCNESLEYSKESEKFEFINDGILEQDEQGNLDPMQLCEVTYKIDEEISDTDEEFHEFGDVFKTDISHENYEWKVPDISNNAEKHDILAGKSEETLEVSNTDEEFFGFSDNDEEISEVEDLNIKGGLISEFLSLWLKSPKKVPNHSPVHLLF